jgi:predicted regulator of Ras-like GTPase activity (Roadblock/LC7/MglB family)
MAFAPLLREIVERCRGGLAAALLGYDGMPIEEVVAAGAPEGLSDDLATAGVEFGRILADIRKASDALAGGALLDVTVRLSRMSFVFCGVDDDTFVAVAVAPDGNTGQARYLIRRQMPALRAEL